MKTDHKCCSNLEQWLPTELFQALSDVNRVKILTHLAQSGQEHTVSELSACCPIDLSVVSRHLKTLKAAGIVSGEKRGKQVFYKVNIADLVSHLRSLADALETCCPDGICHIPIGSIGTQEK